MMASNEALLYAESVTAMRTPGYLVDLVAEAYDAGMAEQQRLDALHAETLRTEVAERTRKALQRARRAKTAAPEVVWDYATDGEPQCGDEAPLGGGCILKPDHTGRHRDVYTSWDRYSDEPDYVQARRIKHTDPEWTFKNPGSHWPTDYKEH